MLQLLDQILLSNDVVNNFHKWYKDPNFKVWITSILPEVEDCKNQEQDTPWHIYNCLDHILHSVEEINKISVGLNPKMRRILAYTMFYHDLGKPKCHIKRYSKACGRVVDSFYNHNIQSEIIADRTLSNFNFNKKEQEIIKLFVHEHDIFMFITLKDDGNQYHRVLTKELLDEYVQKYNKVANGKQLMKYLIMVGRADNLSQNPKLTQPSLQKLDIINQMLAQSLDRNS